jgi:hypothetical protein
MDYIAKVRRDKRRFLGVTSPKNKYQQRKEQTVLDFLFFQKKINNKKKLNEFKVKDIDMYIRAKNWSLSTNYRRDTLYWR